MLRPVPANHIHADALADARNLAADTAKTDDPKRLAEKLHAFQRLPNAAPQVAVELCNLARIREHERERMLCDCCVAVAANGVNGVTELLQLGNIHIAGRAGAKKDIVLESAALRDDRRWPVRRIVECKF